MRSRQGAVLQSLRRARGFLDAHEALLSLANTDSRKALDEVIAQLSEQAVMQDNGERGSRGETDRQRLCRTALRLYHMRPIAEIAKLRLRDVPEASALRMPDSSLRLEALVAASTSMADAAQPYEKVLIANGLAPTFLVDLRVAGETLRASIDGRGEHRRRRQGATIGLVASDRRGRAMLKVLDGLVLSRLQGDAQLSGEWLAARRVTRSTISPVEQVVAPAPLVAV